MTAVDHPWSPRDIVGGNFSLDLVNTVSGWNREPEDWIPDITSLLTWAQLSGILNSREKNEAQRLIMSSPVAAERVLASLKELRLALWSVIDSLQSHRSARAVYLSIINDWKRRLAVAEQIKIRHNKVEFAFNQDISALEIPGLRVTAAALCLLKDGPLARIKTCAAPDCGWKFVDQSKNGSRRWCDMAVCGNSAKATRYRMRNRGSHSEGAGV